MLVGVAALVGPEPEINWTTPDCILSLASSFSFRTVFCEVSRQDRSGIPRFLSGFKTVACLLQSDASRTGGKS
jgi:hypothetical protein